MTLVEQRNDASAEAVPEHKGIGSASTSGYKGSHVAQAAQYAKLLLMAYRGNFVRQFIP